MIARTLMLVQIALRNLFASPMNWVIGGLMAIGTLSVLVGGALLDSLDVAMSRSITGSVTGHAQVYSAASKDELSIYGQMGAESDLTPMEDFPKVKAALLSVPNVKAVVPMGINSAMSTYGNVADLALERLRALYNKREAGEAPPQEQFDSQKAHVRQIIRVLTASLEKTHALSAKTDEDPREKAALQKAESDEFWADFETDPFAALEFLENEIAPQVAQADVVYLRYVGTDLDAYRGSFDRMKIVDGQMVPKGQRGFLISKFLYEEMFKLKNARRLDKLHEAITQSGNQIAKDATLQRYVKENQSQTQEILLQLGPLQTQEATRRLSKALDSKKASLEELLVELFTTDDSNLVARYEIFYQQLAPLLDLYKVRMGDALTLKAFTRSGYVQSANVKVYGTFDFEGLEKSPLAGGLSLVDLMTFRDLYGYMSADKKEELERLQRESGARAVARERAEEELFGGGQEVVGEATAGTIDESSSLAADRRRTPENLDRVYSQEEIESGVVLNAAVLLKDPKQLVPTLQRIEELSKEKQLGLKIAGWQKASGLLGQFVFVAKAGLFFAVAIIFIVAMVVINNAMMMATIQRTQTIGTMRAIGAQRGFVLAMVLVETLVLGLTFGSLGAAIGTGIVWALAYKGIPATTDVMYFFFSGPRLHPSQTLSNHLMAVGIILFVSAVSTLIPALVATRVSPLSAMQSED